MNQVWNVIFSYCFWLGNYFVGVLEKRVGYGIMVIVQNSSSCRSLKQSGFMQFNTTGCKSRIIMLAPAYCSILCAYTQCVIKLTILGYQIQLPLSSPRTGVHE